MRRVWRTNVAVPTLTGEGAGARLAREQAADRAADEKIALHFPAHWNQPDVRGALYAMHGPACAYCGSRLTRGDRGDVEHFRPKGRVVDDSAHGGYWWLAYVFDNYLISCSNCNRQFKRDRFPLRPGGVRVVYGTRAALAAEPRLLLEPSLDEVEEWLTVEWKSNPVTIAPSPSLPPDAQAQVEGTLKFFRINKDAKLLRERKETRDEVVRALDDGEFAKARTMAVRYRAHSLIAKQILAERARAYLPTPKQELLWLLGEFMETLAFLLGEEPEDDYLKREKQELLWSFATLWRDPPRGTSASDVEDFLTDQGLVAAVRKFYDRL